MEDASSSQDPEICEMKEARSEQENRIRKFVAWASEALPVADGEKMVGLAKGKKRIRKPNRKYK